MLHLCTTLYFVLPLHPDTTPPPNPVIPRAEEKKAWESAEPTECLICEVHKLQLTLEFNFNQCITFPMAC